MRTLGGARGSAASWGHLGSPESWVHSGSAELNGTSGDEGELDGGQRRRRWSWTGPAETKVSWTGPILRGVLVALTLEGALVALTLEGALVALTLGGALVALTLGGTTTGGAGTGGRWREAGTGGHWRGASTRGALVRSGLWGWAPTHPLICHQQAQGNMSIGRWACGGRE